MNNHIRKQHPLEKELTSGTALSFERVINHDNLNEQDVPEKIQRYFKTLLQKQKQKNESDKLHKVLGDYLCRYC